MSLSSKYNKINDIQEITTFEDLTISDDLSISDTLNVSKINSNTNFQFTINNTEKFKITSTDIDCKNLNLANISTINGEIPTFAGVGSVLKVTLPNIADYSFTETTTFNETTLWSYSYTPVTSSSYILVEFYTLYEPVTPPEIDPDEWIAELKVNGTSIGKTQQITNSNKGVLLPIIGKYTNSNTTAKTISFTSSRFNAVSELTFYANNAFTVLKITEIKR